MSYIRVCYQFKYTSVKKSPKSLKIYFFSCKFFQFLVIKTLDPDRYSAYNAGSGSVSNEYGYETLLVTCPYSAGVDYADKICTMLH
jgi:hypothetical protein